MRKKEKGRYICKKEIAYIQIQDGNQSSSPSFQMVYQGNARSEFLQKPFNLKYNRLEWKTLAVLILFLFFDVCFKK